MIRRRILAVALAVLAFGATLAAIAAALPFVLGALYGCIPPTGSCGDGVGWAMLISSPITIPVAVVAAAACATLTYFRIARPPNRN